jgi:hypoxanthine phosphoribosyltransferase
MSSTGSIRDDVATVLVTEEQIRAAVGRLAAELTDDVGGCDPLLVGVLTGAFVFLADLVRGLDFPLEVDFINASSYGTAPSRVVLRSSRR